jgi:hypothetical protein
MVATTVTNCGIRECRLTTATWPTAGVPGAFDPERLAQSLFERIRPIEHLVGVGKRGEAKRYSVLRSGEVLLTTHMACRSVIPALIMVRTRIWSSASIGQARTWKWVQEGDRGRRALTGAGQVRDAAEAAHRLTWDTFAGNFKSKTRKTHSPARADQPTRRKRAKFSTSSAAPATLSAGLVIQVAISRARVP